MKKIFTSVLFSALIPASLLAGEWIGIKSTVPVPVKVQLAPSGDNETIIRMEMQGFDRSVVVTPQGGQWKIQVPGTTSLLQAGAPDLPKASASITIPDRGKMKIEVLSSVYKDYLNMNIAPSKGSIFRNVDPKEVPFTYGSAYDKNTFFPGTLASLQKPFIVRDFRGETVWLYPVQYNPVTKTLRVYSEITVRITQDGSNGENELLRNTPLSSVDKEFAQIYSSIFLNGAQAMRYLPLDEEGGMLIISEGSWMSAMMPFIEWKARRGIHCDLVDVSAIGNNDVTIKNYIQNYYITHNLKYLLLVGDLPGIETPTMSGGASDPSYGFLAGTDSYAEVMVGRFSAQTLTDVVTQVQRSIEYEANPTPGGTWYKKATGIASDLGPGDDGEMDWEHERNIRSNMLTFGYTDVDELYDGTHNVADATGDPSSNDLVTAINDGRSVINYTGHGSQNACATTGFSSADVSQLTNSGMLPFWWSVGCVHGDFTNGTCIAEVLTRAQNGGLPTGMVATYMSSINQYWDEPMDAQDEFDSVLTECYVNNIKRTYGGISVNGCMHMNDNYGSTGDDMTNTWHCFGDPSLMIRNNIPFQVTATHLPVVTIGTTQLIVGCNTNGAMVTITKGSGIVASGVVQNNSVTLTFSSLLAVDTFAVTATAFNGIPYTGTMLVIPASGPFVVVASNTVHDASGNNNGIPDYDESIQLDVDLENVGLADATGVTAVLTTADTFITINAGYAAYGTITFGSNINFSNAFSYTISGNIPDQHIVQFDLAITDSSGNTWQGSFMQAVSAPSLEILSLVVNDVTGNNNGFLDPGETADIILTTKNAGHSNSPSVTGQLTSTSPFITINSSSSYMGSIAASGTFVSTLNVSLSPNITLGSPFDLTFDALASAYSTSQTFMLSAGEILEDFESNGFNTFPWYSGGNAPWITTSVAPFQGTYCARSGAIGNSASSILLLDVNVLAADSVSFYKKVSSEVGYDFLRFYIDGVKVGEWSGIVGWSYHAFPVSTGLHTLQWSYEKDVYQTGGLDAAWLDNIQLPPMVLPTGVTSAKPHAAISLYPNPVSNVAMLMMDLDQPSRVSVKLYNMDGSLVQNFSQHGISNKGQQSIAINTSNLSKGIYALQVIANGEVQVIRLVK